MTKRATHVAVVMVLGVFLAGCAAGRGPSSRPASARAEGAARLDALVAAGKPDDVLAYVEETLPGERIPARRARLELERARALRATGRPWSALAAYHAADSQPAGTVDPYLAATILAEWADLDVALGRAADGVARYQEALTLPRLDRGTTRRLQGSLVVAARKAGDHAAAKAWTTALGVGGDREIAAAEYRLQSQGIPSQHPAQAAAAAAPSSGLPTDPRRVFAQAHRRAEWQARPIQANSVPMSRVTSITVHHSAMEVPGMGTGRVAQQIKGIQSHHVNTNGWADIGYHFLIDPSGEVWEGRALAWQGAHAGGSANVGNVGICLLGDFERGNAVPRDQLATLFQLVDSLRVHFDVPASRVQTHREWKPTTECPGDSLHQAVVNYRNSGRDLARQ